MLTNSALHSRGVPHEQDFEEVIDWVTLAGEHSKRRTRHGTGARPFSLKVVEEKTLTVPIGYTVLPHSEMRTAGMVTVKATPYSSIRIPQKTVVSPTMVSPTTAEMKRISRRGYLGKSNPESLSPRRGVGAGAGAAGGVPVTQMPRDPPAPLPTTRRERRILSRLSGGEIIDVKDLPLPGLFS